MDPTAAPQPSPEGHSRLPADFESGRRELPPQPEVAVAQHKLLVMGDPGSGKTCVSEIMYEAMRRLDPGHHPYRINAAPDGRMQGTGSYLVERFDPMLAEKLIATNRDAHTRGWVDRKVEAIEKATNPLVVIDLGGLIDGDNDRIARAATHGVIVYRDPGELPKWREFAARNGVTVVAELESSYQLPESSPLIPDHDGVLRASIHRLSFGLDPDDRPAVRDLVAALLHRSGVTPGDRSAPEVLPDSTYLVRLDRPKAEAPTLQVRFSPNNPRETPTETILRDGIREYLDVESMLPAGTPVLIDGPMPAVLAAAIPARLAARGVPVVGMFDRETGCFYAVHSTDPIIKPGDPLDRQGRLARQLPPSGTETYFRSVETTTLADGSLHVSLELAAGRVDPSGAAREVAERLALASATDAPAPRLYLTGRVPNIVLATAANAASSHFGEVAVYITHQDMFQVVSSPTPERIGQRERDPLTGGRAVFAEFNTVPVNEGRDLHLAVRPSAHRPPPHLQLREFVQQVHLHREMRPDAAPDAVYLNGPLPNIVVGAAAVAIRSEFGPERLGCFLPQRTGTAPYLIVGYEPDRIGSVETPAFPELPRVPTRTLLTKALGREPDPALAAFAEAAFPRFLVLSRSALGLYDTSANAGKPPIRLSGAGAAEDDQLAILRAIAIAHGAAEASFTTDADVAALRETLLLTARPALETVKYRSWTPNYTEVDPAAIHDRLREFDRWFLGELNRTTDPASFAHATAYRLDRVIHPYADGCRRSSLLMASVVHARYDIPFPVFESLSTYDQALGLDESRFIRFCTERVPRT